MRRKLSLSDWLISLSVIYVVVSVTMNIFCMKSLSFGTGIIICDGGTIISWMVFLISNVIVEVWDEEKSLRIVYLAAIVTFITMIIGRIIVEIPTLPEYEYQNEAFRQIFSNGPRTIFASITAFALGNFINIHIIAVLKKRIEERMKDNRFLFFFRASSSTLIGQLADNALFLILAFAPIGISVYEMAWKDIMTAVVSGTVIELLIESCFVPFITIPLTGMLNRIKEKEER